MKIIKLVSRKKPKIISQHKKLNPSPYWIKKNRKQLKYKNKKRYVNFRERLVLSKKNLNKKRYYLFFTKKRNNVFLTITDTAGKVVISQSAGSCKITTKKEKKIPWYVENSICVSCKISSNKKHKVFI